MATPKKPEVPLPCPIAAEIDELGAIDKELAPLKSKISRGEQLRKVVRAHFDTQPAANECQATGARFLVVAGPRAMERKINPAKLIKAIGLKLYAAISFPTLKGLEENVEPAIVAGVVTAANTGTRPLKTFEKPA